MQEFRNVAGPCRCLWHAQPRSPDDSWASLSSRSFVCSLPCIQLHTLIPMHVYVHIYMYMIWSVLHLTFHDHNSPRLPFCIQLQCPTVPPDTGRSPNPLEAYISPAVCFVTWFAGSLNYIVLLFRFSISVCKSARYFLSS